MCQNLVSGKHTTVRIDNAVITEEDEGVPENVPDAVQRDRENEKQDGSAGGWIVGPGFHADTTGGSRRMQAADCQPPLCRVTLLSPSG